MTQIRRSGPRQGRPDTNDLPTSIPAGWHLQAEWEAEHAYGEGYQAGYAAAEQAIAEEIARAVGFQPYDRRDVIKWLIRTTGQPTARRPEPYSSTANGTDLTVQERDVLGRWAA